MRKSSVGVADREAEVFRARTEADVLRQVKKAVSDIGRETGLELRVHRTRIEAWNTALISS